MSRRVTKVTQKEHFLKAYDNSMGNVSEACKAINISRKTFYKWCQSNEKFKEKINEIDESFIDFAEGQLKKNVKRGIQKAIEFTLTNRARDKYSNTQTVEHKVPDVVEVVHYVQQGPPPEIKEKPIDNSSTNKKQNTDTI